jgi:hypothetical protein
MRKLVLMMVLMLAVLLPTSAFGQTDGTDGELIAKIWAGEETGSFEEYDCLQLRLMRNLVYARHGYDFGNDWVNARMEEYPLYVRDAYVTDETVGPMLTPNDKVTVAAILAVEDSMECKAHWDEFSGVDAGEEAPIADCVCETEEVEAYAMVALYEHVTSVEPYLVFEAHPLALMDWVVAGNKLEVEWLSPLTYEELHLVQGGVYARHNYTFEDEVVTQFYANHVRLYAPHERVNKDTIDQVLTNVDKLNLLRLKRAAREAGYEELILDL